MAWSSTCGFPKRICTRSGEVADCLQVLKERGYAYEQDGAVWFASSRFDDDSDRVLVKTDGSYTYLTAGILPTTGTSSFVTTAALPRPSTSGAPITMAISPE
ncbi:MAG: hypothetical protein R2857_04540 [Vampirovibrionales bacterium]